MYHQGTAPLHDIGQLKDIYNPTQLIWLSKLTQSSNTPFSKEDRIEPSPSQAANYTIQISTTRTSNYPLPTTAPTMSPQDQKSHLTTLPPELLLQIIPQIPHSPSTLRALSQTSQSLHALLKTHEQTLVAELRSNTYSIPSNSTTSPLFPSLPLKTYADLATLYERLQVLESLHANWLHLTSHGPELGWLKDRWEKVHKVGTLLLWRLGDVAEFHTRSIVQEETETTTTRTPAGSEVIEGSGTTTEVEKDDLVQSTLAHTAHSAKSDLLHLLPATSLACLIFKCYSAVKILRVHGPDPVHSRCGWEDAGFRCEVELAVEELLLVHGAEFFVGLLEEGRGAGSGKDGWAVG